MSILSPFSRPFYMMAKPIGAACNLTCDYCYYTEKQKLYQPHEAHTRFTMSDETLETFVREYIGCQTTGEVLFTWHGGEPLLMPIAFYRRAMEMQKHYGNGRHIDNCLQTNGTLIDDEWCRFFRENGWLIGISIDGPENLHDACRKSHNGGATFRQVMKAIDLLEKHGVEWNALVAVNSINGDHPQRVYRFFSDMACRYIQLTPVVERLLTHGDGRHLAAPDETALEGQTAVMAPFSVTPEQWGRFLCSVFDEWVANDVGRCFVNTFEATLANWVGVTPGICAMSTLCGHVGVVEWNGDVYSCDHFVFPQYRLGNLRHQPLYELMNGVRQTEFARQKLGRLPRQCRRCQWLFACHGECPRNRFATTTDGETGLNYLCEGYRQFFAHAENFMEEKSIDIRKEDLLL